MRIIITILSVVALAVGGCDRIVTETVLPKTAADSVEIFRKAFGKPEDCKGCHPRHYDEWSISMHAYSVVDPVFHSLNALGQEMTKGELKQFCVACHSPFATLLNDAPNGTLPSLSQMSPQARGGVTCESCHKIEAQRPGHGIDKFRLDGVIMGSVKDPVANSFHASEYNKVFEEGEVCSGCHDVVNQRGLHVEQTFTEWKTSLYPNRAISCQTCHMKMDPTPTAIAVGGPTNRRHHYHFMEGVDVPLTEFPGRDKTIALVQDQLTANIRAEFLSPMPDAVLRKGATLDVVYNVYNQFVGHNVPSGTIFERQMWVEVIVTNENGDTLLASGLTDPNGDLRNEKSEYVQRGSLQYDSLLTLYHGKAYRLGKEIPFFFDADMVVNRTLNPYESRNARYSVPASRIGSSKRLSVSARLLFRAFPPYFLRLLGHGDLVSKLPVFTVRADQRTVIVQ